MLNRDQKIAKNVAKYGWRYDILDEWMLYHAIPTHEKSVFSQLKARTQTFGEKIAKRLFEQYGIEGIFFAEESRSDTDNNLSTLESEALSVFRRLPNDEERRYFIENMRLKANDQSDGRNPAISRKKKAA
jgi:hypothetical protein